MSIQFEVKMTPKIMYDFLLYHTYSRFNGIFGGVVGVAALALAVNEMIKEPGSMMGFAYFAIALVLLLGTPLTLKNNAVRQVKMTEMFEKPLCYKMTEEGITVAQDDQSVLNEWDKFMKVVSTNKSLILYLSRMRAIILPKEALGDNYTEAVKMISTHVAAKKVKIRHVS